MIKPARFFMPAMLFFASCTITGNDVTVYCDKAELRVINTGSDTIYYAFGSTKCNGVLKPQDSISYFVGSIHSNEDEQTSWQVEFCTPDQTYSVEVNECLERLKVEIP